MLTRKCVEKYLEQVVCGEPTPNKIRDYALLCIARDNLDESEKHGGEYCQKHHIQKMDEHVAREWAKQMKNEDGTVGPHWTMEQTKKIMEQHKELQEFELADVFAAINMLYSDYVEVAKKFNVNDIAFYICMTKAWLDDDDVATGKGKTAAYYEYVVK